MRRWGEHTPASRVVRIRWIDLGRGTGKRRDGAELYRRFGRCGGVIQPEVPACAGRAGGERTLISPPSPRERGPLFVVLIAIARSAGWPGPGQDDVWGRYWCGTDVTRGDVVVYRHHPQTAVMAGLDPATRRALPIVPLRKLSTPKQTLTFDVSNRGVELDRLQRGGFVRGYRLSGDSCAALPARARQSAAGCRIWGCQVEMSRVSARSSTPTKEGDT